MSLRYFEYYKVMKGSLTLMPENPIYKWHFYNWSDCSRSFIVARHSSISLRLSRISLPFNSRLLRCHLKQINSVKGFSHPLSKTWDLITNIILRKEDEKESLPSLSHPEAQPKWFQLRCLQFSQVENHEQHSEPKQVYRRPFSLEINRIDWFFKLSLDKDDNRRRT